MAAVESLEARQHWGLSARPFHGVPFAGLSAPGSAVVAWTTVDSASDRSRSTFPPARGGDDHVVYVRQSGPPPTAVFSDSWVGQERKILDLQSYQRFETAYNGKGKKGVCIMKISKKRRLAPVAPAVVRRVFVIRRPLKIVKIGEVQMEVKIWELAHSGLLLDCSDANCYLLEYSAVPGKVTWGPIDCDGCCANVVSDTAQTFKDERGYEWTRQPRGYSPTFVLPPQDYARIMYEAIKRRRYHLFKHNCHMAQERTRDKVGATEHKEKRVCSPDSRARWDQHPPCYPHPFRVKSIKWSKVQR